MGRLLALTLCMIGLPFHCLISLLIMLEDGGRALYKCVRLGLGGKPFTMLKYRSMREGSAPLVTGDFKVVVEVADSRVTRLGRWLRMGIDEFPQLWNIVRGDMAWIGPRPDEPWMLPKYGPVVRERLDVLPGITGLAQVFNARELPVAQGYALDVWYRRHSGWGIQLWILGATPLFMLGWRSIGYGRLGRMMALDSLRELVEACEREMQLTIGNPLTGVRSA